MRTAMSLEEFAALVQMQPAQIRELVEVGLLDPAGEGSFNDLDLLRLMAVRHYEALGYDAQALADGSRAGSSSHFSASTSTPARTSSRSTRRPCELASIAS